MNKLKDYINLSVRVNPNMPDDLIALREVRAHSTRRNYRIMFIFLDSPEDYDGHFVPTPNEIIVSHKTSLRLKHLKEKSLK